MIVVCGCTGAADDAAGMTRSERVVYDSSYFLETEQITEDSYRAWSQSVAILVPKSSIVCPHNGDAYCYLPATTLDREYAREGGFCDDREGIGHQAMIASASATGFLVHDADPTGSRTMLSAGHVLAGVAPCEELVAVFDYRLALSDLNIADNVGSLAVLAENVFECEHVAAFNDPEDDSNDWIDFAVFTLRSYAISGGATWRAGVCLSDVRADRAVETPLYMVGHMFGLSQKYFFGGRVMADFEALSVIVHDLPSFDGNSGAFVMNGQNNWVIGIHQGSFSSSVTAATRADGSPCVTLFRRPAAELRVRSTSTERPSQGRATHVGVAKQVLRELYPDRDLDCATR